MMIGCQKYRMTSETAGARSDYERLISLSLVGLLNNFMSCDHKILNIPDKLKISRVVFVSRRRYRITKINDLTA